MNFVEVLEKRVTAIENSSTNIDCFKHIHSYIDYLLTTPELKIILDAEEADFRKKVQLTEDNIKLENLNFYQSYFVTSYVRIYLPIEHYRNSHEPDSEQDPVALLLLYGPKHPRTQSWVNRYPIRDIKKHRKEQLKSYWSWFDGNREEYVSEINNLHLEIITALSKDPKPTKQKTDTPLHLDLETGDFNYKNVTGSLNVSTQPFKVLKTLYLAEGKVVSYLDLLQSVYPSTKEVKKTDKYKLSTIIKNLRKTLGIIGGPNKDIFHNEKMVGYSLKYKY